MDKPTSFKDDVARLLDEIGIAERVTLAELEGELARHGELASSPLVLGIIARLFERHADARLREIIPLLIQWRNFIPREDLGGLSPAEYESRYPRGEHERFILQRLFQNFELSLRERQLLGTVNAETFNLKEDFQRFEEAFLALIPARQPFPDVSIALTHRAIIAEERRRAGWPPSRAAEVGIILSGDGVMTSFAEGIERIRRSYLDALKAIERVHKRPSNRSRGRMKRILVSLAQIEPFMKCTESAAQFYRHFATMAFICGAEKLAETLARRALAISPTQREMQEFLSSIRDLRALKRNFAREIRAVKKTIGHYSLR